MRHYRQSLQDIYDAMTDARAFVAFTDFETFQADRKTRMAVIRALEIIGQATKNVPEHIRTQYPEVPWRLMAGMRDKLIHRYWGVNLSRVWEAVADLPRLQSIVKHILTETHNG